MTPVLRVIIPTIGVSASLATVEGTVIQGANSDYITEDLTVPVGALYVAKMDDKGAVSVLTPKSIALTPTHTYLGWPIPA